MKKNSSQKLKHCLRKLIVSSAIALISFSSTAEYLFHKKQTQIIEIVFVFNYSCETCYETYTLLEIWDKHKRQPYVKLEKILYNPKNHNEAVLFGLRNHFGFNSQLDKEIMKGLMTWQFALNDTEDIIDFFSRYFGMPKSEILSVINNKNFQNKLKTVERYAENLSKDEKIFFIINYKETTEIVTVEKALKAIMRIESLTSLSDNHYP